MPSDKYGLARLRHQLTVRPVGDHGVMQLFCPSCGVQGRCMLARQAYVNASYLPDLPLPPNPDDLYRVRLECGRCGARYYYDRDTPSLSIVRVRVTREGKQ